MVLTKEQLTAIVPASPAGTLALFAPIFAVELPGAKIDTPQRIGAFISQCAEESINFTTLTELASGSEYEGRKDLGNINPGDGVKYKGRGIIQVTGRGNYIDCSRALFGDVRLLNNPQLLTDPVNAVRSACWFWTKKKPALLWVSDQPETYTHMWENRTYTKVQWLTELVNGGQNGIAQRTANYQRARKVLGF